MNSEPRPLLSLEDVTAARARLAHGLRLTPAAICAPLSVAVEGRVWLKREDLQRTGSFKERGARHALLCLPANARARGVVAASAGNHALGLAFHGAQLGIPVTVVMPATAPAIKVRRCRGLGAQVVLAGTDFAEARTHGLQLAERTGATWVHPFDDPAVMAGQGTLALELLEQASACETVVLPVGGGGLLAGAATALKSLRPDLRVVAVEPAGAACFAAAWSLGHPVEVSLRPTLADGLAVACVGAQAFAVAAPLVDDVVTVTEEEVRAAVAFLARRCGVTAEGAGAVGVAALLAGKVEARAVATVIGGRNIDPALHAALVGGLAA